MEKDTYVVDEMVEHMKLFYGKTPITLNTGSYFMNFKEGDYVRIRKNRYLGCHQSCKQYVDHYPVCVLCSAMI